MVLLYGPTGWRFLKSEVPLYGASVEFTDFPQVEHLGVWYKFVNF